MSEVDIYKGIVKNMKDNEIKEILDRLDYDEWEVDLYKVPITWAELYNIRDYITNLQQRIEKAVEYIKQSINDSHLIFGWNDIQRYHDNEMNYLLNILNGKEW